MKQNKNTEIKNNTFVNNQSMLPSILLSSGHIIEFQIGQIVYLKTDIEQQDRLVTGINLRPNNSVTYCLSLGNIETVHFGIEISSERDIIKATIG